MSAFVVDDRTINRVVTWLSEQRTDSQYHREILKETGLNLLSEGAAAQLAQDMRILNCDAVNQRYAHIKDHGMIPVGDLQWTYENTIRPMQVYKSLRCWLYQCAEGHVPQRPLYKLLERLATRLAHEIVCDLPEYDKAEWS